MLLTLFLLPVQSIYMNCNPPDCLTCISGIKFSNVCLDKCPMPHSPSATTCGWNGYTVFFNKFFTSTSFSDSSIGNFITPNLVTFSDPSKTGPTLTLSQGLYFDSTSSLYYDSSDYYHSDITIYLSGIFKSPGNVFKITDGINDLLRIYTTSTDIVCELLMINDAGTQIFSNSIAILANTWNSFSFRLKHNADFTVEFRISSRSAQQVITITDYEYRSFSNTGQLIFGSMASDGFKGFLLESKYLAAYNPYFTSYVYSATCICDYNEYCLSDTCYTCPSGCSDWPWCIRNSCNNCFTDTCSTCSGFSYQECTACSTAQTAPDCGCGPYCATCNSYFDCLTCDTGYTLIDTICTLSPYLYDANNLNTPVVDLAFNSFEQYKGGIFQSGADPSTYYPYNHETDDPLILSDRGASLSSGVKFVSKSGFSLNLNYQFTVGVWIVGSTSAPIVDFGNFKLEKLGRCSITLTGSGISVSVNEGLTSPTYTFWTFLSVAVKFQSSTTTISFLNQNSRETPFSIDGFMYISSGEPVTITSDATLNIHSLVIYQTYIEIDMNYRGTESRVLCSTYNYYNSYIQSCEPCSSNNIACASFGSNSVCDSAGCQECSGYDSLCTETSSITTNCTSGTYLSNRKCCDVSCTDCFNDNSFSCLSCSDPNKFLLVHVCVDVCPDGFQGNSKNCDEVDSNIVHIVFDKYLFDFVDLTGNVQVSAGDYVTVYPDLLDSQPIPTYKRGFYFRTNSYVKTSSVMLNYNFTAFFFIKGSVDGVLFTKGRIVMELEVNGLHVYDSTTGYGGYYTFTRDVWQTVSVKMLGRIDPTEAITVDISPAYTMTILTGDIVFESSSSEIVLGSSTNSFTGFLYEFKLVNTEAVISATIEYCTDPLTSTCILDCALDNYFSYPDCLSCTNCPNGCTNSISCTICQDILCYACPYYDGTCSECVQNSALNGLFCECSQGYFHNTATDTCDKCSNNCLSCTSLSDCGCFDNSHEVALSCDCDTGYFMQNYQSCFPCSEECETCSSLANFRCLTCNKGYYSLSNMCVNQCPVGFRIVKLVCEAIDKISVHFKFETLDGNFIDLANGLVGKAGKVVSFYPYLDKFDPWPVYLRGLYFSNSFFTFPSDDQVYVLPVEFSIVFWIKPKDSVGYLVYHYNDINVFLSILLKQSQIEVQLLTDIYFTTHFNIEIQTDTWSFFMFSAKYIYETYISISVNKQNSEWVYLGPGSILDKIGNKLRIGSDSNLIQPYTGYIYEVVIYTSVQDPSTLFNSNCDSCENCLITGECINECQILEYPREDTCSQCNESCNKGCRRLNDCNLCFDSNCLNCQDYNKGSCTKCYSGFVIFKGLCAPICTDNEYFDPDSVICVKCPKACATCQSASACSSCSEFAFFSSSNVCECSKGFNGPNSCTRQYFKASIGIHTNNIISIYFTEPLASKLKQSDLELKINSDSYKFNLNLN